MFSLPVFLAMAPFILFLILLLWKRMPLIFVSVITLVFVITLASFFWRVLPDYMVGSLIKGFLVALDIFLIIFGAIFFLEIMKETKIIENIGYYLESISKDIRVQVILLAWFFENFLEGTAGFGTPSTVVAPLLVGLGINPINAVIIALLGNSSSVVFGAAGTPIRVGFGELASQGLPVVAALINFIGILVPIFMLWFLTGKRENGKKFFWEAFPFALWAGIAFSIPSFLSVFLGQEFPSILGAVIGLGLVLVTIKFKIFVPKNIEYQSVEKARLNRLPILKVIFPYLLLITLLVAGKFLIGSKGILIPVIVKHTISYFNPGAAFILAGILTLGIFGISTKVLILSSKLALKRSTEPFLVIAFMSSIAQIMVNSVHNHSLQPSMIDSMAIHIKNSLLPLWAPLVGAFGSFLALSAKDLSLSVDKVLALALVGGAAGNMIALADIIAAEAVVGLKNEENKILRGVIIPCAIYVILIGLVGLIITK